MPARTKQLGTGPARAPKGAKRRALVTVPRQIADPITTQDQLRHFWDASRHDDPPPLRTSFGNFTCVHAVARVRLSTVVGTNRVWMIVRWDASNLAAMSWVAAPGASQTGAVTAHTFPVYNSTPPLSARPLRMSVRITNTTQQLNRAGVVYAASIDSPLDLRNVSAASSVSNVVFDSDTNVSLQSLVTAGIDTAEISQDRLAAGITYVLPPASYERYNRYHDFITPFPGTDVAMAFGDYAVGVAGVPREDVLSYPVVVSSSLYSDEDHSISEIPSMRTLLLMFEGTPNAANEYLVEIHRQDGCRYVANSLGHSFSRPCPTATVQQENSVLQSIRALSSSAHEFSLTQALDTASAVVASGASALQEARVVGARISAALAPVSRVVGKMV